MKGTVRRKKRLYGKTPNSFCGSFSFYLLKNHTAVKLFLGNYRQKTEYLRIEKKTSTETVTFFRVPEKMVRQNC